MNIRLGFRFIVTVAVVALSVSCSSSEPADSPAAADSTSSDSASKPNPGAVFDGTYELTQVQEVRADLTPNGREDKPSTFSVKSFCANESGLCVASAMITYPDIVPLPAPQPIILDYADGSWTSNSTTPPQPCTTQDGTQLQGPYWQVGTFQQAEGVQDGSVITGTGLSHYGPPCAKQYSTAYTFTRTGPVDPALQIPPPDEVAPLVQGEGSALSGTYDFNLTPLSATDGLSNSPMPFTGNFQSHCARTGDQCVSVFKAEQDFLPMMEWSGGMWSSDATYASAECSDGSGQQQTTVRASLKNTDVGSTPAQSLTGELRKIYVGDCPGEVAWTISAARTGG